MTSRQGDLALLDDPVARELLGSTNLAKLAYVWTDGTPRVVPIWFHWTGDEIVLGTPPGAPKLKALHDNPHVSVTIDSATNQEHVLLIRGIATIQMVPGVAAEYAAAARRYSGEEAGNAWVAQVSAMFPEMARIAIRPEWVGILDFQTRFPSVIESAMAAAAAHAAQQKQP